MYKAHYKGTLGSRFGVPIKKSSLQGSIKNRTEGTIGA